jgi:polyketide synthase PksL
MIDFIEYVVAELKSKRLSKANAVDLVKQFSRRAGTPAAGAAIHPLLHSNTSDLSEQRYSSTFTGMEFFLAGHQVQAGGESTKRVLPGVAYLEMARAAVEQALPEKPDGTTLELHNTVWAQPVVVSSRKQVHIALLLHDEAQVDYEVYSHEGEQEFVHCQGRAILSRDGRPSRVDVSEIASRLTETMDPRALYEQCARMGLHYGPSFQAIAEIRRGSVEVLATLRKPAAAGNDAEYVLHPSLMDGALQAAVALIAAEGDRTQPRLPFALDTLRIVAACPSDMIAWLRYAPGSSAAGKVAKLDIDLCDSDGNVCVQMRGVSWRTLQSEIALVPSEPKPALTLLATRVWQKAALAATSIDAPEQHVIVCDLPAAPHWIRLASDKGIAERYSDYAIACFERIQSILRGHPQSNTLLQIVIADELLLGLSGLLRTAALEHPQFVGQLIVVPAGSTMEDVERYVGQERGTDAVVRYEHGERQVLRWEELPAEPAPIAFRDRGVYLITGGTGGLGILFAKEIVAHTRDARVILTGRSALTPEKQARVDALGGNVAYAQVDLTDAAQVRALIASVVEQYGALHGILHSAGTIADALIVRKEAAQFRDVLAPKVAGSVNLDEATWDLDLDFFVLFSALAGAMGNAGQADYAAANDFLDAFAAYRNRLVAARQRSGRTRAIDWPLWREGGLGVDAATQERLRHTTGMEPMQTTTGIDAFHRSLALPYDQIAVAEGDVDLLRRLIVETKPAAATVESRIAASDRRPQSEQAQQYLQKQFSEILKVPWQKIDPRAALENYGIDSIVAMRLTNQLETTFGSLPKTLFFEYQTIRDLAEYFVRNYAAQLSAVLSPHAPVENLAPAMPADVPAKLTTGRRVRRRRAATMPARVENDAIAIVGLSGRYPEAVDVEAYWENLRDGKDCITEVPKDRWDWREYFSDDRTKSGHHYSKWGGFISGVDEFDPLFFNISPVDAEGIDPQERLFLQHAWMAIEDAGYTRASLQLPAENDLPGQVGVYVGVMYTEYQLFGAEAIARGKRLGVPGSAASIANRVSYALNLHGPSMTIDTMCSSSLTAIHLACEDLAHGRTSLAIAGGVNVTIHPNKYLVLSDGQFISSDGHCQSFGEGGDGYIPGEGVGVVVLKRLSEAERDGDHIYGVIRGSALTHGGKTNGYSVPNPQAQASAIRRALVDANVDARHISYLEAHGTGTKLGDPIEIAALSRVFEQYTSDAQYCLIGSAKSNIGHCESAAGIAGLTKVLLQMKHRQIVPSLHSAQLNPHIDFAKSPFIVNQTLRPWDPPVVDGRKLPRLAGISSFGAGGSNAHMIVEEYVAPAAPAPSFASVVIVLSARTAPQLQQKVRKLADFIRARGETIDLASMAYTLQVGREAMEERLGLVVSSTGELLTKLDAWLNGATNIDELYQGQVKRNNETLSLFSTDDDLQQAIERWIASRKVPKLLDLWARGLDVDWGKLYGDVRPRRMSLPVYPFARERYWIDTTAHEQSRIVSSVAPALHPLLHANTSDLDEQRYCTTFHGDEFFLADHQVAARGEAGQKVLPGVAYLEMARAAMERAMPRRSNGGVLELHDIVWAQPVVVRDKTDLHIALFATDDDNVEFEIYSERDGDAAVHCQGRGRFQQAATPARIDVETLPLTSDLTPESVYAACARMGLIYGPSFQSITALRRGEGQVLAHLRLPAAVAANPELVLHPSLMDGALQAAAGLLDLGGTEQPRLPFALQTLRVFAPCTAEMLSWVRFASGSSAAGVVVKLDIDLCDAAGNVCVQLRGFTSRTLTHDLSAVRAGAIGTLLATPVWQTSAAHATQSTFAEEHVLLCDLPQAARNGWIVLRTDERKTIAERYSELALACFESIQSILQRKPQGNVLVRIVVADELFSGLAGLLRTASLENPRVTGQLILVPPTITGADLTARFESEHPLDVIVRYDHGARQVLRWQEVATDADAAPIAIREDGVYLITGGMGGLGIVFAKEILEQARNARVVLTGRSPLSEDKQARLHALAKDASRVTYRQVDLGDPEQVTHLMTEVQREFGHLHGIVHSAGMIADSFILKKQKAHFADVLGPKVSGTWNLDQATKDVPLDFFALFSSIAGALGNLGQADYATANAFMDQFAAVRNRNVAAGQRHGRTRSINWPLWHAGGMSVDAASQELLQQSTGMQPMRTAAGIEAFHRALALPYDQTLVVAGDLAQLRRTLLAGPAMPIEAPAAPATSVEGESIAEKTEEYLRKQFAGVLKLPSHKIDAHAALEEYGIDSVLAMKLTNQLEKAFGALPKTLFFEYQTIDALTQYFASNHAAQLSALFTPSTSSAMAAAPVVTTAAKLPTRRSSRVRNVAPATVEDDPIAIIGLSGRYPEAVNVERYWENLRNGKDCITEVPKDRWDWRQYFSEDRSEAGRHYSKWGGFISGVDEFDPLFFNISPADAELIDPQERLFLQHVWMAVEDAGYTRASLQIRQEGDLPGQVGVYAGVMYSEYQMYGAEAGARGKRLAIPGSTASTANRVSYVLNLHGPSVTLDTMCSSSLTAIHFACQDLRLGRTSMAIAGGVNVSVHPNKYLVLSAGQFISSDGHCQSFGEGGDGYIPGEGVGVVILKRLSDAKRDGDHIYGIIRATALNHGGKTNGYTVPNPQAQASAISRALTEGRVDARHVSYIEAHGTGTTLGDPIEIAALSKVFHQYSQDKQYCRIGSAKSNIGHCESAAGIAGVTKVLLQMQHQQIVPSLHSARLNPHIDFENSPFIVNQTLTPWESPVIDGRTMPRIAGISSFGAGGSNAHVLIEEYRAPQRQAGTPGKAVILLSARTPEQLRQKAQDLYDYVSAHAQELDLASVAYTLQVGREAMEERLAIVVETPGELLTKLRAYIDGETVIEDVYAGQVSRTNDALAVFSADADLQQTVDKWIAGRKFGKLLDLWVKGLDFDWNKLYGGETPQRVSLPAYPFAKERYWIDVASGAAVAENRVAAAALHPLLHSNTSDLTEQRYRSTFNGDEFFLADHQVKAIGRVLPGVAYLEMARAAIEQALPDRPQSIELRNVVWAKPFVASTARPIHIALSAVSDAQIEFEMYSDDDGEESVHCHGLAIVQRAGEARRIDVAQLESELNGEVVEPAAVYAALARMGLQYGPAFRGIESIVRGNGQLFARVRVPMNVESAGYVLHPVIVDSALQAAIALTDLADAGSEPRVPFALESARIVAPCAAAMTAWVRFAGGSSANDAVVKIDADLCDEDGNVCVELRGLSSRVMAQPKTIGALLAAPVWQTSSIDAHPSTRQFAERHVVLCELASVEVEELGSLLPLSQCLSLYGETPKSIARRYSDSAIACFELVQSVLQSQPEGKVLLQIVIGDEREQALLIGLSGLLRTAALENPQLVGQLILVPAGTTTDEVARRLHDEKSRGLDAVVRYTNGTREVLRWSEIPVDAGGPVAFRDDGVYVITGGTGGLGLLFAGEILAKTRHARVVVTGRAASAAEKLAGFPERISYRQLDLLDIEGVRRTIDGIVSEHGAVHGILHSAGMIADRFILEKNTTEFAEVLAPKVLGTCNLDEATKDLALDFFVLFSSVAGAIGNPGQADYAAANGFLDQFASYRNALVGANERRGRTRSINWPLWQAGGMTIDAAAQELLQQSTGMHAMQTATGMHAFHRSLALPHDQLLVVEGDVARLRRALLAEPEVAAQAPVAAIDIAAAPLAEKTQEYLRREFSELLKLPAQKIDPDAALEKYGIDSILAMRLTSQLEKTFGSLSKTLFFEYQTISALAGYFVKAHAGVLQEKLGTDASKGQEAAIVPVQPPAAVRRAKSRFVSAAKEADTDIAIVGVAGRYPQAETLAEFWRNLQNGRDSITEIPLERWDHSLYFDANPNAKGKSYSKWGGFIDDVDKFDPLFFNISPKEAELLDPQERLFLQTAWETIEDAGYAKESITGGRVGVFVGVMWGQYELFGAESLLRGDVVLPGSSYGSIANRVSYFFDFHGPSIALDTMCSSSLTAIHLACDAIRKGEIDAALAGGVNVSIHPYKYLGLSQGKFAASDGRCRSFGAGGDGYVPGEGVGAVLLKPLHAALRDGDQIYAVVKASALNHGGKTNGYTVPNPNAQGDLIREALRKARIEPKTLGYIETHGTGTSLGDPIEITGLLQAFEQSGSETQSVPIGSVKSNIGHLESAAGIAAVTKTLLQIRHQQLVPSLHATPLNPNIDFAKSPFYVQTELADWNAPHGRPRRAGVSSFGAGGSNAHLILEEYRDTRTDVAFDGPHAFILSARSPEALRRYAQRVVQYLDGAGGVSLASLAYTSQVGRSAMDVRLAALTSSVGDLRAKLERWLSGGELDAVHYGNVKEAPYSAATLIDGAAGKQFVETLLTHRDLDRVARLWVLGANVDWSSLYRAGRPRKVSLPTYPFEKERCWIPIDSTVLRALQQPAPQIRRAVLAAPQRTEPTEPKRRNSYVPQWVPNELVVEEQTGGTTLIIDSSDQLFAAMPPESTVLLTFGDVFEELAPNAFRIDPRHHEQFLTLADILKTRNLLPSMVVHHELEHDLARPLHAFAGLCKALMRDSAKVRMLSLHTDPLGAAISGFFRALTLEDPAYRGRSIEVEPALPIAGKIALIRRELADPKFATQEIRYRDGQRFVRTLVPMQPQQTSPLPLRYNGVYLITGGMGGLGILFAEYLARKCNARLALAGRSARENERIVALRNAGAEVLVLQGDVSRLHEAERMVAETRSHFGAIHGVIHAAGVNRDSFILRKTAEEIDAVLAAKVYGTINLDLATRADALDFFAMFSSIAGVLGNAGQCDYAFGNRFEDAYADVRGERTLSIGWPLWQDGGMSFAPEQIAILESQTGLSPLPAEDGFAYFEEYLQTPGTQKVALYGISSRIERFITGKPAASQRAVVRIDGGELFARTETYLKTLVGDETKLSIERIGSSDPLESFGLDSVMINRINAQLEQDLGALPKTLLYEHETVRELAAYLTNNRGDRLVALFGISDSPEASQPAAIEVHEELLIAPQEQQHDELDAVAIIGMHGYYPQSPTLDAYWENLKHGRDLVEVVPPARWDCEELYHPDPAAASEGKIYCKWGGFLDHYDKFDPHFFKISTAEARMIDPQERLFLESVWAAIEDAGYTRERLRARFPKAGSADVGVFVGVTTNTYDLWAPEERNRGNHVSPTAMPWSIANRVSYFFDFNGPSLPVDSACSSSLVALHLACESLRNRECQVAIAGGVNLYLHPVKYQSLCQKRMVSRDGKCHSYGAGDDGFVPGEGVGSLVLKPLSRAIADGDRIHAVIRATAYDHAGRSNGYSAPNPNAQAALIAQTLEKANIDPETISYIEGHGTGTQLGDSIEIAALTKAFRKQTAKKQFIPIGCVKANIGHSESAAGIAGLAKVILQMQHGQLAPSIHSDDVNPNIEFGDSPFYLQHGLSEWTPAAGQPRRALVNSFGAGGVNACAVIDEFHAPPAAQVAGPYVFTLSARNEERLHEYAGRMLDFVRNAPRADLASLCYTLQSGREAMEERLAIVVSTVDELIDRLVQWNASAPATHVLRGSLGPRRSAKRSLKLVRSGSGEQSLVELASRWVAGEDVDWDSLYASAKPQLIAAPTYPFARERYWVSDSLIPERPLLANANLHPLIAYNSSTLKEVRFSSSLPDTAFYAVDHQVNDEKIFPGAGFLEMACIAANMASEQRVRRIRDIVWMQPVRFQSGPLVLRTILRLTGDGVEFVITSLDDENESIVHAEGRLGLSDWADATDSDERLVPQTLKAHCASIEDGTAYYERFRALGLQYGPSFQTIQELHLGDRFALAKLKLAGHLESDFGQFILHPSIIDGALQTIAGLAGRVAPETPHLPFALDEIEILKPVPQTCYAYAEFAGDHNGAVTKFNIKLLNESGEVLVKFRNLYVRPIARPRSSGHVTVPQSAGKRRLLSLSGGAAE